MGMKTLRLWSLAAAAAICACTCNKDLPPVDPKDHAEGMYLKATADYLDGNFEQALQGYEKVRTLVPNDPRLPAAVGEVYLSQGKLEEAEKQFRVAVTMDPKRGTNWSRLGFILATRGRREEAREALSTAVKLNASDFNALENLGEIAARDGHVDTAVEFLISAGAASPGNLKPAMFLRAAELLVNAGRRPEAILLLQDSLKKGAASAEVYAELGDLQVRERNFKGAIDSYRAAAQLSPKDPTMWELVGELYATIDKPGDAELAFRESLRIADRAVVHVSLGRLHLARGEKDLAEEALERALQAARGEDSHESAAIAELLEKLGRKEDALKLLGVIAAEEDTADDVELQLRTAKLARELGDRTLAGAACARVSKVDAGTPVKCPP